jgi:hypothetical protein
MLAKDGFEPWLAGENPVIDSGLDAAVTVRPVSPKMNSPKYNEPDCIEALWPDAVRRGQLVWERPLLACLTPSYRFSK